LIGAVIDETLRFEPTGHANARYVMEDVDYHGTTVRGWERLVFVPPA
jgi:cytochrome P450